MQDKTIPFFLIIGLFISACSSSQLNAVRDLGNTTIESAYIGREVKHAIDDAHAGKFWDRAAQRWSDINVNLQSLSDRQQTKEKMQREQEQQIKTQINK